MLMCEREICIVQGFVGALEVFRRVGWEILVPHFDQIQHDSLFDDLFAALPPKMFMSTLLTAISFRTVIGRIPVLTFGNVKLTFSTTGMDIN